MNNLRNPPRQARSQDVVDRIIDATARILIDDGHGALTTNSAAAEAGISVGSLYRYFRNKDALIAAVVERQGRQCHDQIRDAISGQAGNSRELVARIVAATVCAYRSVGAQRVAPTAEALRDGVFDCHAAALSAISDALTSLSPSRADETTVGDENKPAIIAEIIVALVEAAVLRPSAALSLSNIEHRATAAAVAYLHHR